MPGLVGDIGGSSARFALARETADGIALAEISILRCADHAGLAEAMQAYLARTGAAPRACVVAIAGPVTGDHVGLTNHPWRFSIAETRERLGFAGFRVINDFTALALAVPRLREGDVEQIGGGAAEPDQPIGLIGPGTGLGVSGLVRAGGRWVPLRSEGGHASFAPMSERESAIGDVLRRRFGHVSWERMLSGPGLVNLHEAIAELDGESADALSPEQIAARGLSGESKLCREALELFCAALGTAAGNLVLTLGARGGVYVGGGIVPRLGRFFRDSAFRARFEAKGRLSDYVRGVPSFVISHPTPGLLGSAVALAED